MTFLRQVRCYDLKLRPEEDALGRFSGKDSLAHELCLESENDIKTHEPLVKAVQEHGVKIISQINHVGRYAQKRLLGCQSVAPSAVASRFTGEVPSALSLVLFDIDGQVFQF